MSSHYALRAAPDPDGPILWQRSHDLVELKSGRPLPAGFAGPLVCALEGEANAARLPDLWESPALIAREELVRDLAALGLGGAIEVAEVEIRDEAEGRELGGYQLLNVLGRVACAHLERSAPRSLGDGIVLLDLPVLDAARLPAAELFLLDEDTDVVVLSARVAARLAPRWPGLRFQPLRVG